jgi:superfamily II DNA or RNA helicase
MRSDHMVYHVGMGLLRLFPADSVAGGVLRKARKSIRIDGGGVVDAVDVIIYGHSDIEGVQTRPAVRIGRSAFGIEAAGRCTCGRSPVWTRSVCGHILALRDLINAHLHDREKTMPSSFDALLAGISLIDRIGEGLDPVDHTPEVEAMREQRRREAEDALRRQLGELSDAADPPPTERLAWRLQPDRSPLIAMYLQKPTKGGWSGGRFVRSVYDLDEDLSADVHDQALIALQAMRRLESPEAMRLADWRQVATHPRLQGPDGRPLRVVETAVTVAAVPGQHGMDLSIAGAPQGRRLPGRDLLAVLDDAGVLHLCPLSEAQARLSRKPVHIPTTMVADPSVGAAVVALAAQLPPELAGEPVPGDPSPILRLTVGEAEVEAVIVVRPHPSSMVQEPGRGGPHLPVRAIGGERPWQVVARDLASEASAAGRLREALGLSAGTVWRLDLPAAADLIARAETAGVQPEWADRRLSIGTVDGRALGVRIGRGKQWLDIEAGVQIDGSTIALADALQAARADRGWIRVGGDRLVRLGDDLRRRLELLEAAQGPGSDFAVPLLDQAIDGLDTVQVAADRSFLDLRRRLADARADEPQLPSGLRADLRDYQVDGFRWMARLAAWGAGAVLADDMGLGKTVQAIAMLLRRADGLALVVCPTSVEANWLSEIRRFAPGLTPVLYRDGMAETPAAGTVVIASFGLVTRRGEALAAVTWRTLVVDEAHLAKNADAKRSKSLAALTADWRLALTGTPVENRLDELWAVMRLAVPGLLGDRARFHERFTKPIAEGDAAASAQLRRRIAPFVLRRTKEAVLTELPPLTELVRTVTLTGDERTVYEAERLRAANELNSLDPRQQRIAILAALTRLRQAACASRLVLPTATTASSKLDVLIEILAELKAGGHKALVFSQFTRLLDLAAHHLDAAGVTWLRLDGSTPAPERPKLVERFQAGSADAFLISLKAGGTGLNLTAASYVIHLDPWWNPAAEDQATDRAHRMGQERPVTVYRLVAAGTIEERIIDLHREKRDLVDAVLADSAGAAALATDDLLALVRQSV